MTAKHPTNGHPGQASGRQDDGDSDHALVVPARQLARVGLATIPSLIADAGEGAVRRTMEFFTANIRNRNTRFAYARAIATFSAWCTKHGLALEDVTPIHVAGY